MSNSNELLDSFSHSNKQQVAIKSHAVKWHTMRTKFVAWSRTVTYHCYPKIFKPEASCTARIIWLLVFVCFSSSTGLILISNILAYYQFNVVSTIQVVSESPTLYPKVTICDSNPFTTKEAELLISDIITDINYNVTSYFDALYLIDSAVYYAKHFVANPEYGDVNRQRLGFNLSILTCYFNGNVCDFYADFKWFYHFTYGNCFQFNAAQNYVQIKETTFEGESYGLALKFGPVMNKNSLPSVYSQGLKVFVHNQSFEPSMFDSAVSIKPGEETNIAIRRTFSSSVAAPYSACTDLTQGFRSDLYEFIVNSNRTYRQRDCFYLNFQRRVIDACGCFFTGFSRLDATSPPCLNSTQYACFCHMYTKFVTTPQRYVKEFELDCPLECDKVTYDLQVSSLVYPNEVMYLLFKSSGMFFNLTEVYYDIDLSTYEKYKQYFYSLNVFYPEMQYTLITETPQISLTGLMSSLGGSLGMFLGFSVFSFVEVIELFAEMIQIFFVQSSSSVKISK